MTPISRMTPMLRFALAALLGTSALLAHAQTPAPATAPAAAPTPTATPAPATPVRVRLVTSMGDIVLELYPDKAPGTVQNFLQYVDDGHYNGTIFHRVIADMLVQGGAFTPDLQQKPSRQPIASEADNGLSNQRGWVAAARDRAVADSATAQFFINTVDNRSLDYSSGTSPFTTGYTVFGRVIEGIEVIDRIRVVPTRAQPPFPGYVPATPVVIERAERLAMPTR